MSRKSRDRHAQEAAAAASEAGRILQAQGQAVREQDNEPPAEKHDGPPMVQRDDSRQKAMESLYEARRKANPDAFPEEPKEEVAEEKKPEVKAEEPKPGEPEVKAEVQEEVKVEEPETPEAPKTLKQKVDGVEYEVPVSEIEDAGGEKAWRIQKASENRLAKANELVAQTRQIQAAIAEWSQKNIPQEKPVSDDEFIKSKMDLIRFGSPEESAAALREVNARLSPQINPNILIAQATVNMKHDLAKAQYEKENADVLANPLIKKLADQLEREALSTYVQNGQPNWQALSAVDWAGFYQNIGTQIKSVFGLRQSQPVQSQQAESGNPSRSDREVRKASIVNLPTAAAARAAPPAEEKPETREQSLERMKRARGIQTG